MKKMLILSYSPIEKDPRVYRQIEAFKDDYNVTTLGYSSSGIKGVKSLKSYTKDIGMASRIKYRLARGTLLKRKKYEMLYWSNPLINDSYKKLKNLKFDVIIANDINTLPLALKIKGNAKVLFDAHEYFPRHFENNIKWKKTYQPYNVYLCEKYMPLADSIITVSKGIAEEYYNKFNVKEPLVITNATDYQNLSPSVVNKNFIRIIHHGLASEGREIENMIRMMDYIDNRFHLDLMLIPRSKDYYNYLKKMAMKRTNVNIVNPVPMQEISNYINEYDIGLTMFPPSTFNLEKSLPNKFFEFIQARLMLAVGPLDEMEKIVKEYNLGIVSKDFTAKEMAEALNKVKVEDIEQYKRNSNLIAGKVNAEINKEKLNRIVGNMI